MKGSRMTIRRFCIAATSAVLLTSSATAADWPDWRGPMQDRHYDGPPLVTSFDPEAGTNVLWKSDEAGGISTPVIMRGKLFTLVRHKPGTTEEAEKVLCLDATTGKKLWENVFNVYLSDVPAERVGWSAVIADPSSNTVFAHGVHGDRRDDREDEMAAVAPRRVRISLHLWRPDEHPGGLRGSRDRQRCGHRLGRHRPSRPPLPRA